MSLITKKHHKLVPISKNQSNQLLTIGQFGIKSYSFMKFSENQLKWLEWVIKKEINFITGKKSVKIWNFIYLNTNLTKLSPESRMGKGKGQVYSKACFIKPGKILFEFDKISNANMSKLYMRLSNKFPGKTILVN